MLLINLIVGSYNVNAHVLVKNINSDSIDNRIIILEQMYNAQSELLLQQQQQIINNKNDINALRGQIQQNNHQINQMIKNQQQIAHHSDIMHDGIISMQTSNITGVVDTHTNNNIDVNHNANISYKNAIELIIKKKNYDQAIIALQIWVKKYPDSAYQANANYWLGQLLYNQGKKDDATYYFATVVKKFPKSVKASEALFKIGVIMQENNDKEKAKAVYQEITKLFPNSESAKQAQKRLDKL